MVLLSSPICDFGRKMPEFKLKGLDDNFFDSQKIENYDAILIFFGSILTLLSFDILIPSL